jgi:general secretion pathway protein L
MSILIIQLTGREVVIARFEKRRSCLVFLQGGRREMPLDAAMETLLDGFTPSSIDEKVILALHPHLLSFRELAMPISDRRRLREVIPLELAGETAAQGDELLFDAVPVGDGKVMAAWCRQRDISPLVGHLAAAGLDPEIITVSLPHWSSLIPEGNDDPTAVTDGTALAVFTGKRPVLLRPLPEEGAEQEIARSLAALDLGRGIRAASVLRHGPAADKNEPFALSRNLTDAFAGDTVAARDLAGAYAVALAFCSHEIFNFRGGALAYTAGMDRSRRRLRMTALLAALLVALVAGEAGLRYWLARRDVASLDASIRTIHREIFPSRQKPVDPIGEVRSEIRRLGGGNDSQPLLPVLTRLAELKGDDIPGFYEVEITGRQARLKGDARSAQAVNEFKTRSAELFNSPEVAEIKTKGDGGVSFSFRGTIREGKP